jgi:hypothetical protein
VISLEQDLAELHDRLPAVTDALAALAGDAHRLASSVSALTAQLRVACDDSGKSLAAVRSSNDAFESGLHAMRDGLASAADGAESLWDAARTRVEDTVTHVQDAAGSAAGGAEVCREALVREVGEWSARLAPGTVEAATGPAADAARATVDRLHAAAEDAAARTQALREDVAETARTLQDHAAAYARVAADAAGQSTAEAIFMTGESLWGRLAEDDRARTSVTGQAQDQAARVLAELEARLLASIQEPVANAAGAAGAALWRLCDSLGSQARALRDGTPAVAQALSAVDEATSPLRGVEAEVQATVTRISVSGR